MDPYSEADWTYFLRRIFFLQCSAVRYRYLPYGTVYLLFRQLISVTVCRREVPGLDTNSLHEVRDELDMVLVPMAQT